MIYLFIYEPEIGILKLTISIEFKGFDKYDYE